MEKILSKEFEFFIYLLQRYAAYKNMPANEVLDLWNSHTVHGNKILTEFIQDMYMLYHCERLENAFMDIDYILEHGVPMPDYDEQEVNNL